MHISLIITIEIVKRVASSFHNSVKFFKVKHPISISIRFFKHFFEFFVWDFFPDFISNSFQVFESNFIEIFLIKKFENLMNLFLWISWSHSWAHNGKKLIIADSFLELFAHIGINISDILLLNIHSESFHNSFELSCVNLT